MELKTLAHGILLGAALLLPGCGDLGHKVTNPPPSAPTELVITDLAPGTGPQAVNGDTLDTQYTGWLSDGTRFDSSLDRGVPFRFVLGRNSVIKGWEQGLLGIRLHGRRRLVIPPELGYGANGSPPVIPPNATIVFEVEAVGLEHQRSQPPKM